MERSEARGEFERADSSIVDFVPRELNGEAGRRLWYAVLVSVEGDDDLSIFDVDPPLRVHGTTSRRSKLPRLE